MTRQISNETEAIAFLSELVAIPSPSGLERPAVECLVREMAMYGAVTEIDAAGNGIGIWGSGSRQIVLLGHIDTVTGWPEVRRTGDLLYGRGSVDAKGPLAALTMAAALLGAVTGWQVVVVGATEEEAASSRGARQILERFQPVYCIIGEPSAWNRLTLGYKGRLLIDYNLVAPMGHTAGDTRGACETAVLFWQQLAAYAAQYNLDISGRFNSLDPSLRRFNSSDDGLQEQVTMQLGLRLPPGFPQQQLVDVLQGWRGAASLSTHGYEQAFSADKRTALTAAFLSSIRTEGGQPSFVFKTGTSDMNVVGPRWQCPLAAYGPGDSALDHTPGEHLDLQEYLRSIRVLRAVLTRLTAN